MVLSCLDKSARGGREDRKMPVIKSSQKKEASLEKKSRNKNSEKQYLHCDTKYGYNDSTIYRMAQRIIFCLSAPLLCLNTFFLPPAPPHPHKSCLRRFRRSSESVRPWLVVGTIIKPKPTQKKKFELARLRSPHPIFKSLSATLFGVQFFAQDKMGLGWSCRGNFFSYFVDFFAGMFMGTYGTVGKKWNYFLFTF